ncbi:uncharacterized protein LOC130053679 [Ostrea edulis]|uniref:uncharacterized protein LOC130053679 n=1 Tax=Ostrea edulis TaxID=37623 RepID=UPI0024AEE9D4|nr:uncharacterized protein LOC130053679 [Ostrea edulis]
MTFSQIFFSTGTYVKTTLQFNIDWFLQTYVYPSVADVDKSSGLCGILGKGTVNDLTRRNGAIDDPNDFDTINHPNDFSMSWRVEDDKDLLNPNMDLDTLTSLSRVKTPLCTCNSKKTECSYISYTDCGTISRGKQYPCLVRKASSRRKRNIRSYNDRPVKHTDVLSKRSTKRTKRDVTLSADEATTICNAAFEQSITYQTCFENVADFSNDSIQNCVLDVMVSYRLLQL